MKRRGRPVRGAISGLLLGILGAIDLSLFNVRAPDSLTVIGLPVAGFVLGIALGMKAPFGSRRVAELPAAPVPAVAPPVAPPPAAPPARSALEPDPWDIPEEDAPRLEPDEDE